MSDTTKDLVDTRWLPARIWPDLSVCVRLRRRDADRVQYEVFEYDRAAQKMVSITNDGPVFSDDFNDVSWVVTGTITINGCSDHDFDGGGTHACSRDAMVRFGAIFDGVFCWAVEVFGERSDPKLKPLRVGVPSSSWVPYPDDGLANTATEATRPAESTGSPAYVPTEEDEAFVMKLLAHVEALKGYVSFGDKNHVKIGISNMRVEADHDDLLVSLALASLRIKAHVDESRKILLESIQHNQQMVKLIESITATTPEGLRAIQLLVQRYPSLTVRVGPSGIIVEVSPGKDGPSSFRSSDALPMVVEYLTKSIQRSMDSIDGLKAFYPLLETIDSMPTGLRSCVVSQMAPG